MLVNLHVKNFAIIDEIDVDFKEHLNILTGETGAGKSILVGSVTIALGGRVSAEMIRNGADYALVELVFQIDNKETLEALNEIGIYPEDGQIIISRKIMDNRSINKVNGESVPVSKIKQAAELCIDIHGQHSNRFLLQKKKHLEIIDEYKKEEIQTIKEKLKTVYNEYKIVCTELEENKIPEEEQSRQQSFLEYEKNEIENAKLKEGEEEELEQEFKRLNSASDILNSLGHAHNLLSEQDNSVSSGLSYAIKDLQGIAEFDSTVCSMLEQLTDIESLTNDLNYDITSYISDFTFDEGTFREIEERLNLIRTVYNRFGGSYAKVSEHLQEVKEKLEKYEDYDAFIEELTHKKEELSERIMSYCSEMTKIRKAGAQELCKRITDSLAELNFNHAKFSVKHNELTEFTANGMDDMEFLIAANQGEELSPLVKVASGGELSRIMLAVKTVFAGNDKIETLIFDEIDTGISGKTAWKVSEKLALLGRKHQIICITHLAQIAAMADTHYVIEKVEENKKVHTDIYPLNDDQSVEELSRILSGAEVTQNVRTNAREMKEMAKNIKKY
ncbi:MAG: DNA repair protein RecN [Lachnoclostridium sp.]|nr:DNA repair protein RecN [Lachnoclostridium sp.]